MNNIDEKTKVEFYNAMADCYDIREQVGALEQKIKEADYEVNTTQHGKNISFIAKTLGGHGEQSSSIVQQWINRRQLDTSFTAKKNNFTVIVGSLLIGGLLGAMIGIAIVISITEHFELSDAVSFLLGIPLIIILGIGGFFSCKKYYQWQAKDAATHTKTITSKEHQEAFAYFDSIQDEIDNIAANKWPVCRDKVESMATFHLKREFNEAYAGISEIDEYLNNLTSDAKAKGLWVAQAKTFVGFVLGGAGATIGIMGIALAGSQAMDRQAALYKIQTM